ncbi:MAG: acyl-CoA dehydrogenase family protein [Novosphingobium sp.]|jgi:alkylation response protein AidB-like acyl-CoA dehydrogenase|nr:acyl-CoA dehydrogenase family protein [Novosphingobium sp.]
MTEKSEWAVPRLSDKVAADLWLPGEILDVRARAREFADDVLRPAAHGLNCTAETREGFRHDIFKAIAAAGLYKVPYGLDVGGLGLEFPVLATLTVMEELAYYSPGVASAMFDGQAILVGKTLDIAGGATREKWLPGIVRGDYVAAFATSEPEASTDLSIASLKTVAEPADGGWRINGRKRWITNSVAAERVLLLCRTGDAMTTFFVDMKDPGVTVSDPDLKMGNHPQLTADIRFDGVFVADQDVIGGVGAGLRTALGGLALGRMGIGAAGVGMAQRALDVAAAYSSQRLVYGRPIAAFQHWQFRFAEHALAIETARSLYQKAGTNFDRGGPSEPLAAMSKIKGSEIAVDVARDAIQACGGYGFAREIKGAEWLWPLESIYRDAKIGEIYEGANEVQKWLIARHLLGRSITG